MDSRNATTDKVLLYYTQMYVKQLHATYKCGKVIVDDVVSDAILRFYSKNHDMRLLKGICKWVYLSHVRSNYHMPEIVSLETPVCTKDRTIITIGETLEDDSFTFPAGDDDDNVRRIIKAIKGRMDSTKLDGENFCNMLLDGYSFGEIAQAMGMTKVRISHHVYMIRNTLIEQGIV